jgi:RNA polymerase II C-terminal domain phosphatase-like 3/4
MFEMYIYTMGDKSYAIEIAKLLDPGNVYFGSQVISNSDCTQRHQKGLDVVLGAESTAVILDDTEHVSDFSLVTIFDAHLMCCRFSVIIIQHEFIA